MLRWVLKPTWELLPLPGLLTIGLLGSNWASAPALMQAGQNISLMTGMALMQA